MSFEEHTDNVDARSADVSFALSILGVSITSLSCTIYIFALGYLSALYVPFHPSYSSVIRFFVASALQFKFMWVLLSFIAVAFSTKLALTKRQIRSALALCLSLACFAVAVFVCGKAAVVLLVPIFSAIHFYLFIRSLSMIRGSKWIQFLLILCCSYIVGVFTNQLGKFHARQVTAANFPAVSVKEENGWDAKYLVWMDGDMGSAFLTCKPNGLKEVEIKIDDQIVFSREVKDADAYSGICL